ncbi:MULTISPECIES: PP2C family protein-serine/threonine phosphatase [Paenarthrobacter]|uniref:SpoIIE family protein phosphatase n=1 Tax=Paenarthrobacter ureafaciens TaxID=37931 RepID=A0AAX3EGH5_PAEUR|nr:MULTISPECIES: SpoIIE family protein phosphatase [Paenarthrobacter]NKR14125.1 two-component system response regulator [Arthrobacter sp. M5]NKR17865.1 two-component system response regulator [Arthrobacter sp. M6]OEH56847.1 two-component system response regulator [Arthrobacter sp. D4]OEH63895.1 two-component system response regulator [Arthrobacter sp. D2]MDO5866216.1 SpoIIE family protein phosphatase [Paenarthrobacter sp. SD-2]
MVSPAPQRHAVVIEDDEDIRGLLVVVLEQLDFIVTEAADGSTGVEAVKNTNAELVTLDINLPDFDGMEVCRRLREFSDAYILMLTARADELDRLTGLDTGADDYLIKPFSPKELQARIRALFRRARTPAQPAEDPRQTDELARAAVVQQSLLPQEKVRLEDFDVAGAFRPSRSVGGDFYDWYQTPDGVHLTFADAMGKGMGAALIAATVRAVMRSVAETPAIDAAFSSASATIASDLDQSGSFVTMFHARLDSASGRLSYIDAGHGLGLYVPAEGSAHRLVSAGPPVGILEGQTWPAAELTLEPGDSLVIVSDGVLDAHDSLEDFVRNVEKAVRAESTSEDVCAALLNLAPAATAEDDVTAVVVRRKPAPLPAGL